MTTGEEEPKPKRTKLRVSFIIDGEDYPNGSSHWTLAEDIKNTLEEFGSGVINSIEDFKIETLPEVRHYAFFAWEQYESSGGPLRFVVNLAFPLSLLVGN